MKTYLLAAALFASVVPTATAAQSQLRYEWSASAVGPYAPIPTQMLKVQADGSATVATPGPRGFFRLFITDGAGGGGSVPIRLLDSVPATTLAMLNRFIIAVAEDRSEEGAAWTGATISPFVTPVTSAWNDTGEPDMVELKIIGRSETTAPGAVFANDEGRRRSPDRGFILASLSRKSPPIVGYATTGPTQCETLLASCRGEKPVHCIRRFGPMFLAAEDSDKNLIGNEGLFPAIYSDTAYQDHSRPVSHTFDSENPNNPPMPAAPPRATPQNFSSYPQLLDTYRRSAWLTERRQQREALIEFDWLAMEGRAPTLAVNVSEEKSFLPGVLFTRFSLDDEDGRGAIITLVPRVPGVTIRGLTVGAHRLTLFPASGVPQRYLIVVSPAGAQLAAIPELFTTSQAWSAGTESQLPRYSQRKDLNRWCPAVGCGPVMLALQVAWAEHNQNVPSAYWNRDPNASLASRRDSLRQIDSPMDYSDEEPNNIRMMQWYDHFHDTCNVACWVTGAGSAVPWDVGNALESYALFTTGYLLPTLIGNDLPTPLVGGSAHWEADGISDDWDESGVLVADRIKAGRPSGVYYLEHMHYCQAWRYRKTVTQWKVNGVVINSVTQRLFRVNTGWGNVDRVWNAYDIDGCYLLNLQQKRMLTTP